ncbi:MAG: hypothetical protein ACI4T4_04385 [Limosilactobacillus sp.]
MRRKEHRRRWSWWLIGTLAILVLVLGTWSIMRPGTSKDTAEPETTVSKKAKKKAADKKTAKSADQAEKAQDATPPATAKAESSPANPSGTTNADPASGATTTPGQGTTSANTGGQDTSAADDGLSYDDPASAAAGTAVGAELTNLVAELNKLASQYTEFQDVTAFNSGLDSVQARNSQLLAQSTTWADQNLATKINGTIERMRADPANAQYIVNHIWH